MKGSTLNPQTALPRPAPSHGHGHAPDRPDKEKSAAVNGRIPPVRRQAITRQPVSEQASLRGTIWVHINVDQATPYTPSKQPPSGPAPSPA